MTTVRSISALMRTMPAFDAGAEQRAAWLDLRLRSSSSLRCSIGRWRLRPRRTRRRLGSRQPSWVRNRGEPLPFRRGDAPGGAGQAARLIWTVTGAALVATVLGAVWIGLSRPRGRPPATG